MRRTWAGGGGKETVIFGWDKHLLVGSMYTGTQVSRPHGKGRRKSGGTTGEKFRRQIFRGEGYVNNLRIVGSSGRQERGPRRLCVYVNKAHHKKDTKREGHSAVRESTLHCCAGVKIQEKVKIAVAEAETWTERCESRTEGKRSPQETISMSRPIKIGRKVLSHLTKA